jgi:hypothetical protein
MLVIIKHAFSSNIFEIFFKMTELALQLFHFVHEVKWRS